MYQVPYKFIKSGGDEYNVEERGSKIIFFNKIEAAVKNIKWGKMEGDEILGEENQD